MSEKPFDKIGVFVAGGPAAGINGVLKGIVQEAANQGIRVVGFLDGARGLYHGYVMELTRTRVEDIAFLGGSIIGTSRFDPRRSPDGMERILATLRHEGVDGVVSIGGEGTLLMAETLRQRDVRIVHVPKTIDNDVFGVSQTFGFDTAVNEASRLLTAIKLDAHTSGTWFMVEIMGRYTGHLALEAGLAAGATRVLIPEEGTISVEELVELVAARRQIGANWGVVLVAESSHFGEGYITRFGRLGGVAEALAERLDEALADRGMEASIRFSNLGYFLRCAEPTGFDKSYAAQLGTTAARFLLELAHCGEMVTVEDDQVIGVPIPAVAGKLKPVDLTGVRYRALKAIERYEAARGEAVPEEEVVAGVERALRWLHENCDQETVGEAARRLGITPSGLLRALEEVAEVATGAAERRSHTAAVTDARH